MKCWNCEKVIMGYARSRFGDGTIWCEECYAKDNSQKSEKPDSLSLCQSCGCMTNTTHDEETVERCGKCGKNKDG